MNINTFGLMRRAGALELGQDKALAAVKNGKAKLLVLPSDAGDRAKRNAEFATENRKTSAVTVPWTNRELSEAVGIGGCTMMAVTNKGFADAILKEYGGK